MKLLLPYNTTWGAAFLSLVEICAGREGTPAGCTFLQSLASRLVWLQQAWVYPECRLQHERVPTSSKAKKGHFAKSGVGSGIQSGQTVHERRFKPLPVMLELALNTFPPYHCYCLSQVKHNQWRAANPSTACRAQQKAVQHKAGRPDMKSCNSWGGQW